MKSSSLLSLPASLLLFLGSAQGIHLPYNPTRIFRSPQNDRLAYVLQSVSTSSSQFSLASLDFSQRLTTSSLPYSTLYSTLPFLKGVATAPVDAVIDGSGSITVYTGNCSTSAQIWRLSLEGNGTSVGSWKQQNLMQAGTAEGQGLVGANFLTSSLAFSSNVTSNESDTKLYFFGGMCPLATFTPDTWQTAANYSSSMVTYTPSVSSKEVTYREGLAALRTQPIPQAGHSIAALEPTYSNRSDGTRTQQQNFVLLGGHTQTAFLNTSQVALFSLPQEAWTYFPVKQPSGSTHSDATGDATSIDPRSGHTSVLSADGTKIILFGGWVGNVNNPASPQLAILNVGAGYGGQNDWSWSVPATVGVDGLPANAGIYGHGALMLPGNVMLIVGGYSIAAPSSPKVRRDSWTQSPNNRTYIYNVTSNTWLSEYTAPASTTAGKSLSSQGPLSTVFQKAGLGTGLGIGAAIFFTLLVFYLWNKRRLRKRQEARDLAISELAFAAHPYGVDERGLTGGERRGFNFPTDSYSDHEKAPWHSLGGEFPVPPSSQPGWRGPSAQEAERTGLLVEIPSPTRGLRRKVSGRGSYPYDHRMSRNAESIHPIAERDEEDPSAVAASAKEMNQKKADFNRRTSAQSVKRASASDPFTESINPARSRPVPSQRRPSTGRTAADREYEVQGWLSDWQRAAEALLSTPERAPNPRHYLNSARRMSNQKSERVFSSLSDPSAHPSGMPSFPTPGGVAGLARSLSSRHTAFLSSFTSAFSSGNESQGSDKYLEQRLEQHSPTHSIAKLPSQKRNGRGRGKSLETSIADQVPSSTATRSDSSHPSTSTSPSYEEDPFSGTSTSLAQLQAEGDALLGSRYKKSHVRTRSEPLSPMRERKAVRWVGSVKRAMSVAYAGGRPSNHTTTASTSTNQSSPSRRHVSGPSALMHPHSQPQRTGSDAGFLRGRRGAMDWLTEDPHFEVAGARPSSPSATLRTSLGGDLGSDDDWDVERAAENRVVQLMFTVPRQRLRVVNVDGDGRSLVSCDEDGERDKVGDEGKGKEGGEEGEEECEVKDD